MGQHEGTRAPMKILFVTSEFADFAKAGGLADVSAALPRALRRQGVDVRVLMPAYQNVLDRLRVLSVVGSLPGRGAVEPCLVGETKTADGIPVYLILAPSPYQRAGTPYATPEGYDWGDNDLRFARLALAAAEIGRHGPCRNQCSDMGQHRPSSPTSLHFDGMMTARRPEIDFDHRADTADALVRTRSTTPGERRPPPPGKQTQPQSHRTEERKRLRDARCDFFKPRNAFQRSTKLRTRRG